MLSTGSYLMFRQLLDYPIHSRVVSMLLGVTFVVALSQWFAWRWLRRSSRLGLHGTTSYWLSLGGTYGVMLFALLAELFQRDHPFFLGTFDFLLFYLLLSGWLIARHVIFAYLLAAIAGLYAYLWTGFHLYGVVPDMNIPGNIIDLSTFVSPVTRIAIFSGLLLSTLALLASLVVLGHWLIRTPSRLVWCGAALLTGWIGYVGVVGNYAFSSSLVSRIGLLNNAQQRATVATIGLIPVWFLESLQKQGRMLMLQQRFANNDTDPHATLLAEWVRTIPEDRLPNVHMVLLESWIDFRAFSDPRLRSIPIPPEFTDIAGQLTVSDTPVFGGGTANAEFEALCGVRSLSRVDAIEFNSLRGDPTACLPWLLSKLGYRTVMTSVFEDTYFNSRRAYDSIGFDEQYYACSYCRENGVGPTDLDAGELYDGDLFTANLDFLGPALEERGEPIFNYLVTGYGHYPFIRNRQVRPDVWRDPGFEDDLVQAANISYYREIAVARLVDELRAKDPDSIVVLFGDHLPIIEFDDDIYKRYGYHGDGKTHRVPVLFVVHGKVYKFAPIHHYDIPYIILGLIRGDIDCDHSFMCDYHSVMPTEDDYYRIIYAAQAEEE